MKSENWNRKWEEETKEEINLNWDWNYNRLIYTCCGENKRREDWRRRRRGGEGRWRLKKIQGEEEEDED